MVAIAFLVADPEAGNLNCERSESLLIRACLARRNKIVFCAPHNEIYTVGSTVWARGWSQHQGLRRNDVDLRLKEAELLWVLGLGIRNSFLDRMQLLRSLDQSNFVNGVDAFVYLHAKHALLQTSLTRYHPYSIASDDPNLLSEHLAKGGDWILKPAAGSFGRSVFLLAGKEQSYRRALLDLGTSKGFFLLQKKVDTTHEKRWLVVNNRVIGAYGKKLTSHRGNLHSGSTPFVTEPSREEHSHVEEIATHLSDMGIRYAAIDVAHPYLLDVNLANPGWLSTYRELTGRDMSPQVLSALLD